jgi:hypothetical protein
VENRRIRDVPLPVIDFHGEKMTEILKEWSQRQCGHKLRHGLAGVAE